ncbi:MAG: DUF2231 domain-containing protein [Phycisphaeraceae bacterium]
MSEILELWHAMMRSLSDPQQVHALWVHLPIGAAVAGLLLMLLLTFTGGKAQPVRWSLIIIYVLGMATGYLAMDAGEDAHQRLMDEGVALSPAVDHLLHEHEEMGEKVWMFMGVTALLVLFTAVRNTPVRLIALVLALTASVATLGWISVVGHYGGTMVYSYGVGTPTSPFNLAPPASSAPPTQPAPTSFSGGGHDQRDHEHAAPATQPAQPAEPREPEKAPDPPPPMREPLFD